MAKKRAIKSEELNDKKPCALSPRILTREKCHALLSAICFYSFSKTQAVLT